jgi:hypothetical protein
MEVKEVTPILLVIDPNVGFKLPKNVVELMINLISESLTSLEDELKAFEKGKVNESIVSLSKDYYLRLKDIYEKLNQIYVNDEFLLDDELIDLSSIDSVEFRSFPFLTTAVDMMEDMYKVELEHIDLVEIESDYYVIRRDENNVEHISVPDLRGYSRTW